MAKSLEKLVEELKRPAQEDKPVAQTVEYKEVNTMDEAPAIYLGEDAQKKSLNEEQACKVVIKEDSSSDSETDCEELE